MSVASDKPVVPSRRLASLDVFRGITIFLMIVVNTAGPGATAYAQLVHAKWFGFTLADAVFPSFLFAMGTAMSFALGRTVGNTVYVARLLKRGAIIFVLGYLMYWFPFFDQGPEGWAPRSIALTRVPGVLQRIALCYVIAGLLVRWLSIRSIVLVGVLFLLGYWMMLIFLSPAGLAYDKFGNIGTQIDLQVLGAGHLYKKDGGFDPEGLLGTIPAVVNVLCGYLAGRAIRSHGVLARLVWLMALAGGGLILAALAWSPFFPVSKKLWTGSYVLLTVGLDCLVLAVLVWFVEISGRREGVRFFTLLGINPLVIYLFSELFVVVLQLIPAGSYRGLYDWLGKAIFQSVAPGPLGSLLCACTYAMVCWGVGWWLNRRGLILKA